MPIISFRIRDEETQRIFEGYCQSRGLSKGEAFTQLVQQYCVASDPAEEQDYALQPRAQKQAYLNHLQACFREDGGELSLYSRYFYKNRKYLIYPYYRCLGKNESKVVKVEGAQVQRLAQWAAAEGLIPLVAVFVIDRQKPLVLGVMDVGCIPRVQAEPGVRIPWEHVFLREDNGAVYIHVRAQKDFDAIREITCKSLPQTLFTLIYKEKD